MDRPEEQWKGRSVCADNVAAAFDATSRLIALGHQRIAFLRYISMSLRDIDADSKERHQGFLLALAQAGRPAGSDTVFNIFSKDSESGPSLQALFDARPRFTAVLSADTGGAGKIMRAAQARELQIPKHLSLVCFQGIVPSLPQIAGPRLDFEAIGRLSIHVLRAPEGQPMRIRVPLVWTEGASVAPADPAMLA